jgi:hypothetical protein
MTKDERIERLYKVTEDQNETIEIYKTMIKAADKNKELAMMLIKLQARELIGHLVEYDRLCEFIDAL